MKKIFKLFGVLFSVALMGLAVSSCFPENIDGPEEVGLGIKTIFPTKVVPGLEITVNGSGFNDITEIVFPEEKSVTNFEKVTDNMLRVVVPAGVSAGKLIVKTENDQAESPVDLTVGNTVVKSFSAEEGAEINGGEQLTIYGDDLEFISSVEFFDPDGNSLKLLKDSEFYRKGTSTVVVTLPKKMAEADVVITGKITTIDGKVFNIYTLNYKPSLGGGHWETKKTVIWTNEVGEAVSWSSKYRFAPETNPTGEEIAIIPTDIWEMMKTTTFYLDVEATDPQVRVTTGWWGAKLTADDIQPGNELIADNGDGTWTVTINMAGTDLAAAIDAEHLLFTGDRFTPVEIYFLEEVWVAGEEGHMEIVKTDIWTNEVGEAVSWSSKYRFAPETNPTGEEIAIIPTDVWEKMKTTTFYLDVEATDPQVRVTTGWWGAKLTADDIQPGNELITDNGDGTWTITINMAGTDLAAAIDAEHLLFTGDRFTPISMYFAEEVWVEGGGNGGPKEVDVWINELGEAVSWSSKYRFAPETNPTGEEIAIIPTDVWEKLKSTTFYLDVEATDPQVRVTTGWWGAKLTADDIQPGNELIADNGDGTWTITINMAGTDLAAAIDAEHLLFTGDRFTPLKFYFLE
jgi:hypothetical protein